LDQNLFDSKKAEVIALLLSKKKTLDELIIKLDAMVSAHGLITANQDNIKQEDVCQSVCEVEAQCNDIGRYVLGLELGDISEHKELGDKIVKLKAELGMNDGFGTLNEEVAKLLKDVGEIEILLVNDKVLDNSSTILMSVKQKIGAVSLARNIIKTPIYRRLVL
jgi:hypothetical protein